MVETVRQLFSIDYLSFFAALITILGGALIIKQGIEKFCEAFGIEAPWMKAKREREEYVGTVSDRIEFLSERTDKIEKRYSEDMSNMKDMYQKINDSLGSVSDDIAELQSRIEKNELDKRIKKSRGDIINFAGSLSDRKYIPLSQYNFIFNEIKEYEEIIQESGISNGQIESSVRVIRKRYEHDLEEGCLDES